MFRKLVKIALVVISLLVIIVIAAVFYITRVLPDVGPAPDIHIEVTPARWERGKYLALYVAGCNICHSARDNRRYSGPIVEGTYGQGGETFTIPEGTVVAPNISPLKLDNWTDGEIYRAITTGVSKDGHALFPIMPYQFIAQLDQEDLFSIIAYIRTWRTQPSGKQTTHLNFPMNLIVHSIPKKAAPAIKPDTNDIAGYGRYMVTAAHCANCHSPRDRGEFIRGQEFSGGRSFPVNGGIVTSANITPDKQTGIGAWTKEIFIARFKYGLDSNCAHPVSPGEMQTIMPWTLYAHMTDGDLAAIFAYLQTVSPVKKAIKKFRSTK